MSRPFPTMYYDEIPPDRLSRRFDELVALIAEARAGRFAVGLAGTDIDAMAFGLRAVANNPGGGVWWPVSERMPEEGARVLLIWANQSNPAQRVGGWWGESRGWMASGFRPFELAPTHWMKLPTPPPFPN